MLDAEKPDAVAVCNNNGERAAAILAAVEHKSHVIAEKPLALDRADLARIKAAVAQQGVKLGMLLDMRYEPPYRALREIVRSGALGEIAQISAQKSYIAGHREQWYTRRETYGSTILWIGIHMIDLMRFTSGREFTHVSSFMGHVGFPELGAMQNTTASTFRLDNGGAATLHMDYYRPETAPTHGDDRLRLAGTRGVAEYMAATGVTLITKDAKLKVIEQLPPAGSVFLDFLESIYLNKPATLPLADIYRVCEVTLAADEAAWTGRVVEIA
jgi:predicted dehydrogenase